jgi:uncharacterized protein YeaO (DUF488 family)
LTVADASIYDPEPPQGWRVLVMRYWPRGVRKERVDLWLPAAAPSRDLLRRYTHEGLSWDDFEAAYRAEMQARPEVIERLQQLEQQHGTLVLLCHERIPPQPHCHRRALRELIEHYVELRT